MASSPKPGGRPGERATHGACGVNQAEASAASYPQSVYPLGPYQSCCAGGLMRRRAGRPASAPADVDGGLKADLYCKLRELMV